jgi:hypothetical protein
VKFKLRFTEEAADALKKLEQTDPTKYKKIRKTLGMIEINLRHPSLQTHKYNSITGPNGEAVFEAYVENKTPAAFRVFWYYGPDKQELTILTITPHP